MTNKMSLDSLPFDIFYEIAVSLDDRDLIHLSRTNRALHDLTLNDLIARKTVERGLLFSKEGQKALANHAGYTYRKAVGHQFDIHEAVATAAPYSVSVLAFGADFLYNQGVLCYRVQSEIRLLDVHSADRQERVLDLLDLLRRLFPDTSPGLDTSLLQYADGILVFRIKGICPQDTLVAIDMETRTDKSKKKRLLFRKTIPASAPVFVRHCRTYLWYGAFTAVHGSGGIWRVCGVDLTSPLDEPIQFTLDHVLDKDLGGSLCFEIYHEHLYAVSTQIASEDNERHSFYHWLCHAPRNYRRRWNDRLWRREHCEGPLNEMWIDLSIRTDEVTDRPVILECRREWADGKSENHRTYYSQRLPTPEEALAKYGEGSSPAILVDLLKFPQTNDTSNEHRPAKRLRRDYHAEFESTRDQTHRQDFIAARTKHRSYNLPASTFIDLVNDPASCDGFRSQDRLRLRTVSRKRKCPVDNEGEEGPKGLLLQPAQFDEDGLPVEGSEERYVSCEVHMWPSDDCPKELQQILCPDSRIRAIEAISDERSLIYSIQCMGLPAGHKAFVLISFDPKIRFPTLSPLHTMDAHPMPDKIFPVKILQHEQSEGLIRESQPLYQAIKWGYWLR